ncbi:hypothetical protein [Antarcticirhabdus aurantiaca]|uniref:Uncharacterized protein n=1 Tax=Antarcticirhabdus aurantiaca TaxID=2606717 RepID=A0ACD4NNK1_9HYPH|nr:hypothetical protein [Antarcticirhabdus aurantiaca]WAJ28455.1 hypothetical protein OXU80_27215 [Jeongeuplla avenae]
MPILRTLSRRIQPLHAPADPAREARIVDFWIEKQELSNWCWVSALQSISNYGAETYWSQREVAAEILKDDECLHHPDKFDEPRNIRSDLEEMGGMSLHLDRALTEYGVRLRVDGQSLAVCLIGWGNGTYHYVLVSGWDEIGGDLFLHVCDPAHGGGPARVPYSDLLLSYNERNVDWVQSTIVTGF